MRIFVHLVPGYTRSAEKGTLRAGRVVPHRLPPHTFAYAVTSKCTTTMMHQAFMQDYNETHPVRTLSGMMSFEVRRTGLPLPWTALLDKVCQDRDDVYVVWDPFTCRYFVTPQPWASCFDASKLVDDAMEAYKAAVVLRKSGHLRMTRDALTCVFEMLGLPHAAALFEKDVTPQAVAEALRVPDVVVNEEGLVSEEALGKVLGVNLANGLAAKYRFNSLREIGGLCLDARQYEEAVDTLRRAIVLARAGRPKVSAVQMVRLHEMLGEALFGLGQYALAYAAFSDAKMVMKQAVLDKKSGVTRKREQTWSVDNQLWIARCLYERREEDSRLRVQAVQILEVLLRDHKTHPGVLIHYAKVAVDMGQHAEVVPYVIHALANVYRPTEELVQGKFDTDMIGRRYGKFITGLFAEVARTPKGLKAVLESVRGMNLNTAKLYVAQNLRKHGVMKPVLLIERMVLDESGIDGLPLDVESVNAVLTHVHNLEICYRYQDAVRTAKQFFRHHDAASEGPGNGTSHDKASVCGFYGLIRDLEDLNEPSLSSVAELGTLRELHDAGSCQVNIPSLEMGSGTSPNAAGNYSDVQLDVLGLMFAVFKILFLHGAVKPMPAMERFIEALRPGTRLHHTHVRNEHAFFTTIAQVLPHVPVPIDMSLPKVYALGDSHCVPPAWQTVTLDGVKRIIVPRLVTGIKVWHLRPESQFYTKVNWKNALKHIPNRSHVIMIIGEIDCRGGTYLAAERYLYRDEDEALRVLVDIFVKAATEVAVSKDLRVYVHPVPPVMETTREFVDAYNAKLKQELESNDHLFWIDFDHKVLLQDQQRHAPEAAATSPPIKPEYNLDQTHLSPQYVADVLEPSLNAVFRPFE